MNNLSVVIYDRCTQGSKRLDKTVCALVGANSGQFPVEIKPVNRPKKFMNEPNAHDLLLQDDVPYDAAIINAEGMEARGVIDDALIGFVLSGRSSDRIIVLGQGADSEHYGRMGVTYVPVSGGNGHVTPDDASNIVSVLERFYQDKIRNA